MPSIFVKFFKKIGIDYGESSFFPVKWITPISFM